MDDGHALRIIQEAISTQVEATDLMNDASGIAGRKSYLKVLVNDGPEWYEIELTVRAASNVTLDEKEVTSD